MTGVDTLPNAIEITLDPIQVSDVLGKMISNLLQVIREFEDTAAEKLSISKRNKIRDDMNQQLQALIVSRGVIEKVYNIVKEEEKDNECITQRSN